MAQGRVKRYSAELGYGFILLHDKVQSSSCATRMYSTASLQTLEKSTEVTYEAVEGVEGPKAKNVYKA